MTAEKILLLAEIILIVAVSILFLLSLSQVKDIASNDVAFKESTLSLLITITFFQIISWRGKK